MSDNKRQLSRLEKMFEISPIGLKNIIGDFHLEMEKGLAGKKSSLKMIPAYVSRPTGKEKGIFLAIDLGGTNLRILELELKGEGKFGRKDSERFVISKSLMTGRACRLFDFIASSVKKFLSHRSIGLNPNITTGFTFSFPVRQMSLSSGRLTGWTKGFRLSGAADRDVVDMLNESLGRKGLVNVKVVSLVNDTVATLAAKSYQDSRCDLGVIIGTGTNACYPERSRGGGIINIEWGNFNKLRSTPYDRCLDRGSDNPHKQILEKMVSGMYLAEIASLALKDLSIRFKGLKRFTTEHMSAIEGDLSPDLGRCRTLLNKIGLRNSILEERRIIKRVCGIVSLRASRISASAMAAVITRMDPDLSDRHTVAIDGSVYERHPAFAKNVKKTLKEIFAAKASRVRISLTKDGSGSGSAVIAAVAS
jgi:hexokinase